VISARFVRFALVGAAGFVVDSTCLMIALGLGANFLEGRGISYLTAATFTWGINRIWTFARTNDSCIRQWAKFVSANAVGGIINYCVYATMMIAVPARFTGFPVLAVAVGSGTGLLINFTLSKRFVFISEPTGSVVRGR
jgi:putative flippase GtrA